MEKKISAVTWTVFNELRLEDTFCDVVIEVNSKEFNAHKIILCGCSSYFRVLFTSGWSNSEKRVYTIPGVSPDIMQLIIEYAYTRSVPVTEENVEELLAAADQFSVMGIVQACYNFLKDQLCPENCIGIWEFADIYYCPDLRRAAYLFILYHFEEMVCVSEEFLELSPQQLVEIIENDNLNAKKEEVVFEAILHWINHSCEDRKAHISVLLPKVRMAFMCSNYFYCNVANNALVEDDDTCKSIIISAKSAIYKKNMNGLHLYSINKNIRSDSDSHNPMTRPRMPHDMLLTIGGWSDGSSNNSIEAYDARAEQWVNVTIDEGSPRAHHGVAYLNGFVYCIGGFDGIDYCFNTVCKFNPVTRTWHQVAPMHSRRGYVSVAVLNGRICAMGGFDGHMQQNTAEFYDPETNRWTLIAPMHEQRSDASATTLHGKVYICGGSNGPESLFTAECYNPQTDQWSLFTAECYNPQTNQWTLIAPMRRRRSALGVIAYGEQVYAVGGFDGAGRLRSAEAYNPLTNTWGRAPSMLSHRSNFGIEVVDDLLFVVGGFNGLTSTSSVECYNDQTEEWHAVKGMRGRSGLSCCVMSGLSNVAQYAAPRSTPQRPQEAAGGSV